MSQKPRLVILSGAGVSAESGLKTFRDSDGLWENHKIEDVATPEGFRANPGLVLNFYNQRRKQLSKAEPNAAHFAIAQAETWADVYVVTQNVDDLHERAGSTQVLHLHGKLTEAKSKADNNLIYDIGYQNIELGDFCKDGFQLRPNIVWFGEAVPLLDEAAVWVQNADYLMVVGTSLNVYPAAQLIYYANPNANKAAVDPSDLSLPPEFIHIKAKASVGISLLLKKWQRI
jgi:NAD-dependent deacetylase